MKALLFVAFLLVAHSLITIPMEKKKIRNAELRKPGEPRRTRWDGLFSEWPHVKATSLRSIPQIPMTNYADEVWVGSACIGTPLQCFNLVLDSGSSNLWVPSIQCDQSFDTGCKGKNKYDETNSTSSTPDPCRALFIPYGTGFVLGYLSNDTVTFGGVKITNVQFGQALYMASFFANVPIDGILGLAFPDIATDKVTPVLDRMNQEGLLEKFEFSVYLDSTPGTKNSRLFLGGVNSDYYTGNFTYADVLIPSYWLVGMGKVYVDNKVVHSCGLNYCPAVIDTGTSILLFSPEVGDPIIKQIGSVNQDCSGVDQLPVIAFSLGGITGGTVLTLEPEFYVIKNNGTCVLGIETSIAAFPLNILGDPFLRKYYTVFDREGQLDESGALFPRVGFALAKHAK